MRHLVVALVIVGAACSSGAGTTTTVPSAEANRLVVLAGPGSLLTMNPDGSDTVTLVDGSDRLVIQPTWSPGGERLAWTEVVSPSASDPVVVVTARPDGSDRIRTPVGNPPFYLSWNPSGEGLVLLRNGATQLEAGFIDVAGGGGIESTIASGQPFYFAWDPTGSEILANIGVGNRLETIPIAPLDEAGASLGVDPGLFQAPAWVGDQLFWVRQSGDDIQELVVSGPAGDAPRVLATYEGFVHFVVSPDGERLAYRILDQAPPAVAVAFGAQSGASPAGALTVVDVESGDSTVVDESNPVTFFWSPDSQKVLYLSSASVGFAWSVWNGETTTQFEAFVPSTTLGRDYLPFFDQFAASIEFWAPDSESFVYAGTVDDQDVGIWVQPLEGPARRVADGVFAAFIPAA